MAGRQGQWEGTEGFKRGNPKRHLDLLELFQLDSSQQKPSEASTQRQRVYLNGLTGNLKISVGVTVLDTKTNLPIDLPGTNAITLQIYPYQNYGNKIYARPVFQDPTAIDNQNHPMPQACPFFWEGPFTEADGLMLEVIADPTQLGSGLDATIVAQATIEYNGAWWDVAAFVKALGTVEWGGAPDTITLFDGGG